MEDQLNQEISDNKKRLFICFKELQKESSSLCNLERASQVREQYVAVHAGPHVVI